MRTIKISIKLEPGQAVRLQSLAAQCGLTPEQVASAIAMLALSQHLPESQVLAGPLAQQSELRHHNSPVADSSTGKSASYLLPETGFLRLTEIVGGRAKSGLTQARLIPVSRSKWLAGVKSGTYPQPVKLGARITAWRAEDIRALIQHLGQK